MALFIRTERLVLSPMRPIDAGIYSELIAERGPGARGFGTTPGQAAEKIGLMAAATEVAGVGFLAVRHEPEGEMLGYCGLLVGRASLEEPEIAYELLRREHGHGYATEAAAAVIEAAAATGRDRLWATVGTWNTASLRVMHKTGFRQDHIEGDDLIYFSRALP